MVNNRHPSLSLNCVHKLFSKSCLVCEKSFFGSSALCRSCEHLLSKQRLNNTQCCSICSLPIASKHSHSQSAESPTLYCGECIQQPPPFERCLAAVRYAPISAKLINHLKHHRNLAAIKPLVSEMIGCLEHTSVDRLIPIPLHNSRLRRRGFNQSVELARLLGTLLDIPVDTGGLHRQTDDPPQQGKSREERQRGLSQSFAVSRSLSGQRIALVDDVVTTTATCAAATKRLLDAGALSVEVWCFARTPSD